MSQQNAPWPWPGDSREDKAKRVAASYRQLVLDIAQGRSTDPAGDMIRLDWAWIDRGIHWHMPSRVPLDPEGWMSAADLAHLIDRKPRDIYDWARRGHVEQRTGPDGAPQYSVQSVISYQKSRRRRLTS